MYIYIHTHIFSAHQDLQKCTVFFIKRVIATVMQMLHMHTAAHCITLQRTSTQCTTLQQLQHTAPHCTMLQQIEYIIRITHQEITDLLSKSSLPTHCNTYHHTTTHKTQCKPLQHTAKHLNILQPTATHCNPLQHTAPYCTTLHHTAPHCTIQQHNAPRSSTLHHTAPHCNTLHHTAPHCNSLQHTAPHRTTLQLTATHCNPRNPLKMSRRSPVENKNTHNTHINLNKQKLVEF